MIRLDSTPEHSRISDIDSRNIDFTGQMLALHDEDMKDAE
jgi:hypothetical protein